MLIVSMPAAFLVYDCYVVFQFVETLKFAVFDVLSSLSFSYVMDIYVVNHSV